MKFSLSLFFIFSIVFGFSQIPKDSLYKQLQIDTNYAYFQYADEAVGQKFLSLFENAGEDKVVLFHYGGSHIQAGRPTKVARELLQAHYGNGGMGMIFNYTAADSYNSVFYTSTKTGAWSFSKSYIAPAKVPLGVCGMSVETSDPNATLGFDMTDALPGGNYEITLFTEIDSTSYGFEISIGEQVFSYPKSECFKSTLKHAVKFQYNGSIDEIRVKLIGPGKYFRFYGIDVEKKGHSGVVYHSLGVGAAAMNSVNLLEKMEQQASILSPDIVILDFGTNDIMYHNEINPKLVGQVEKAIQKFRAVNPEILVVLTSTQDLYYKSHYITAGPAFRDLMDSLAKTNHCMFWNWYDCSGGLRTIRNWEKLGYAKSDNIHLTNEGYAVKGEFIAKSIENTLAAVKAGRKEVVIPGKQYELNPPVVVDTNTVNRPVTTHSTKKYTVKSGDTLSKIAEKNHTTVAKIKSANGLRSDMIKVGQVLKIP